MSFDKGTLLRLSSEKNIVNGKTNILLEINYYYFNPLERD